jgi:hypothetical protein
MLCRVALVRTDVSEDLSASFIRVTRFGELWTTLAVTSNRRTLRRNTKGTILHSHRRENLKSYINTDIQASSDSNLRPRVWAGDDSLCLRSRSYYDRRSLGILQMLHYRCQYNNVSGDLDDNSIQFNSLLFMCRVNSHRANYRHSTVQIYITT